MSSFDPLREHVLTRSADNPCDQKEFRRLVLKCLPDNAPWGELDQVIEDLHFMYDKLDEAGMQPGPSEEMAAWVFAAIDAVEDVINGRYTGQTMH